MTPGNHPFPPTIGDRLGAIIAAWVFACLCGLISLLECCRAWFGLAGGQ